METKSGPKPLAFVFFQTNRYADGGVRSAQVLLRHFSSYKPIVFTQKENTITEELKKLGLEVLTIPVKRELGKSIFSKGIIQGFKDLLRVFSFNLWFLFFLRKRNIKVVHCNDVLSFLYCGIGATLARAKTIFVLRRSFESSRRYSRKYHLAFCLSRFVITLSQEMREELLLRFNKKRQLATKVVNLYSGVDREKYFSIDLEEKKLLRKSLNFEEEKTHLAYVGAFTPRKGQLDFLREVCLPLKEKAKNFKIHFIGDYWPGINAYSAECETFIKVNELTAMVEIVGGVEEVINWYRACDFVVLASASEGLARAMIESLAVGTPVISFEVSSAKEILKRYNCGVVIEKDNYPSLCSALVELCNNNRLQDNFRQNALKVTAELFDANQTTRKYEELYDL